MGGDWLQFTQRAELLPTLCQNSQRNISSNNRSLKLKFPMTVILQVSKYFLNLNISELDYDYNDE